jgi:hypothetical protein
VFFRSLFSPALPKSWLEMQATRVVIQRDINCSVDLRSTTAVGDRRYNGMRKHSCPSVWLQGSGLLKAPAMSPARLEANRRLDPAAADAQACGRVSKTSRTLRSRDSGVKDFWRNAIPLFQDPMAHRRVIRAT